MFIWLVTLRAADGRSESLAAFLERRLLPLLRSQPECDRPALARCVNCAGEHTYLAYWPTRAAVEAFESGDAYGAVMDEYRPLLRVPPKRELWEIVAP